MRNLLAWAIIGLLAFTHLRVESAIAGKRTAVWNLNPASNQWQDPQNWTPTKVPDGDRYIAQFGASNTTNITVGSPPGGFNQSESFLDRIHFTPGAPAYTLTLFPNRAFAVFLTIDGAGIINDSGIVQNIVLSSPAAPRTSNLGLNLAATVSKNLVLTNGGSIKFSDTASAGGATYINEGGLADFPFGGSVIFYGNTTTAGATFVNNPGAVSGATGGMTVFDSYPPGSADSASIICNAATVPGAGAGSAYAGGTDNAGATYLAHGAAVPGAQAGHVLIGGGLGYGNFIAEGGTAAGAAGALLTVDDVENPDGYTDQNVLVALGGTDGGDGGTILLIFNGGLGTSQFQVFGNGLLDLSSFAGGMTTIGSLAGDGMVNLAGRSLEVGKNNLDTVFGGVIQGAGAVTKLGTGTWTVSGTNTYTGPMYIDGGVLGGSGLVPGKLTVGTGSGAGAALAPAAGSSVPATLLVHGALTFNADGSFNCLLAGSGTQIASDQVAAKGVTILGGAQFNLPAQVQGPLASGTVFTVINNTASTPISGAFVNLPNGSTLTAGENTLKVSYTGGDGNDLTLTVQ